MTSQHPLIDGSGDSSPGVIPIAGYIWRVPFLRNIFLVCLMVAAILPLYNSLYNCPAYRGMLSMLKQHNARSTAAHIQRMLNLPVRTLSAAAADENLRASLSDLKTDFALKNLWIRDTAGNVLFSTAGDAGINAFSPLDRANSQAAENPDALSAREAVVVPIAQQAQVVGAVAFDYDMTAYQQLLDMLMRRSTLVMSCLAAVMMAIVVLILFKAAGSMMAHSRMDEDLRLAREQLERRVQDRTVDLIAANNQLENEILERRQAEEALRGSERRYRTLVETIPYGILEVDTSGTITFINPACRKIYGAGGPALTGNSMFSLPAAEEDRSQLREHFQFVLAQQPAPGSWFSKDLTADGRLIDIQVDWNYKRDAQGLVVGLIAIVSEITHHKQAQKALLDNLQFMNTMIDTIPNPVFYKDAEGNFLGCNAAYARTLGLPKEKILGHRLIELTGLSFSDMAEHFHRQDLMLVRNPGVQTHEEQIRCADGKFRDFLLIKATFQDTEEQVAGLVGIMLDITERKAIEKQLKEHKALFEDFMRHLPGLAFIKDLQGRYIFINHGFAEFTGTHCTSAQSQGDDQFWEPQTALLMRQKDEAVLQTQAAATATETVRLLNMEERHLLSTRFPIFQEGALFALGGVSIDVTERTRAEDQRRLLEMQLQQAQKMEALGTLAGGIAHDFNNILAAIIGYSEIVAAETPRETAHHRYLGRVLEAGERARALVKQILTFSRQSETEARPVQVKAIVKEVLKLLRASLPVTIDIVQQIQSDAAVMADPVQIHQVMMNLCTNAGYAMREKGGRLTVGLQLFVPDKAFVEQYPDLKQGDYLRLTVADTGCGIASRDLPRIFDPFFTTKPKGQGTGMGLAVVHGIVTGLGGIVRVESLPERGARFEVYLPVIDGSPAIAATIPAEPLPLGKERILFVDDEVFQTDMLKHMVGLLGYRVEARNQPIDALSLLEKEPSAFDLVITDQIMPQMTGDELARRILQIRPDLPIILCTGYSENIDEAAAKSIGIKAYALKPLVMEELARLIRRVLDAS